MFLCIVITQVLRQYAEALKFFAIFWALGCYKTKNYQAAIRLNSPVIDILLRLSLHPYNFIEIIMLRRFERVIRSEIAGIIDISGPLWKIERILNWLLKFSSQSEGELCVAPAWDFFAIVVLTDLGSWSGQFFTLCMMILITYYNIKTRTKVFTTHCLRVTLAMV